MTEEGIDLGLRFEVRGELDRGPGSLVLAVRDRLHGADRAAKVATRRGQVRRYQAEYRRLSEFRHPNIVRVFDYGTTSVGYPFYTLELIDGQHLGAFTIEPEGLGVLAMQVLDALATLHARGWVHRDLKPKNVLVVGRGTALLSRLIDFGLMARVGQAAAAAGTLPFMAPEVARNEPVDGRADLYSLGVALYEALLPDDRARTMEDVARRMRTQPAPPSEVNPAIPTGLSDFVMKLVEPRPEDRFHDAVSAADALARVPGIGVSRGPAHAANERLVRGGATAHRPSLLRRLRALAREVRESSAGRIAVLEGDIGLGKTPILRELNLTLNLNGFRVARVRTSHRYGSPVRTLMMMANALGADIGVPPGQWMLDPRAHLSETSAFAGQLGVSVAAALGREPTVLLIDDLHRAEPVNLEALQSLGQALATVPLLVLCAGDRRGDGLSLAEVLDADRFVVAPLSRTEVRSLVAHRLAGLELPVPALERILRDSEGMPSLVERTLARMLAEGTVRREGNTFTFAGGQYRPAHHADNEAAAMRVDQVQEEHLQVLWAAAALARNIDAATTATLADVATQEAGEVLAELARLEILHPVEASRDPVYAFANRDVLSVAYQRIPFELRRDLHERAAVAVGGAGGSIEERAEHLLKSSNDDLAIDAAIQAGDRATLVHADRRAIEYFARAYARIRGTQDVRAAPLAFRLGRLFERTGELERASVWYQTAANAATKEHGHLEVEATLGLGAVAYVRGFPLETDERAARALDLLEEHVDPRMQAMAHRLQALVADQRGETERAAALLERALSEVESAGAGQEVVDVLLDLARFSHGRGEHAKAVHYARQAQQRARILGDPSRLAEACTVLARGFVRLTRFDAAKRALLQGLRVARRSGDRLREGLVLREIGNMRMSEADLSGALVRYQRSLELVRTSRARADESAALHAIGVVRTRLGDFRAGLAALNAALDIAHTIGDVQRAAATASALGYAWARLGDLGRARAVLNSALDAVEIPSDPVTTVEASTILGWVVIRAGHTDRGHQLLARLDGSIASLTDPAEAGWALLHVARCAVLLEAPEAAQQLGERLQAAVEVGGLGDLQAAVTTVRGEAAALAGDEEEAIALLTQAALEAGRLELRPLEIDARAALGRLLIGSDQGAAHLTRAMEVARDVVGGLSSELAAIFLATGEAQRLRADFRRAYEQTFGAPNIQDEQG